MMYMIFIVKAGPVNTSKDNSVEVTGTVIQVYEGGVKDLAFKLKNNPNVYYINRALENGFDLHTIKNELVGEQITLWCAKSRRNPEGGGHMIQLQYKDSLYYTEWEVPLAVTN